MPEPREQSKETVPIPEIPFSSKRQACLELGIEIRRLIDSVAAMVRNADYGRDNSIGISLKKRVAAAEIRTKLFMKALNILNPAPQKDEDYLNFSNLVRDKAKLSLDYEACRLIAEAFGKYIYEFTHWVIGGEVSQIDPYDEIYVITIDASTSMKSKELVELVQKLINDYIEKMGKYPYIPKA